MTEKELKKKLLRALAAVKPYLESHGGGLKVVSVRKGKAVLRAQGACAGCPLSKVTFGAGMEKMIKEKVPEIKKVEFVN